MTDDGVRARLTWVGHSTVVLDLAGVRLVTDPLLRRRIGPLVREGALPPTASWQRPDAVLLSHLHHDHADLPSLRRLGDAAVVTGPRNQPWAAGRSLTVANIGEGQWWSPPHLRTGGREVEIRLVEAVHHSRRMPHRPNQAHGFLVRTPEVVVYFAGDTSLYPAMADLPGLAGRPIDLALLPIGGWGPVLSDGHLGPESAARAAAAVGAQSVVPIHYGTLHPAGWPSRRLAWMGTPLPAFAAALRREAPSAVLHAPAPGHPVEL